MLDCVAHKEKINKLTYVVLHTFFIWESNKVVADRVK